MHLKGHVLLGENVLCMAFIELSATVDAKFAPQLSRVFVTFAIVSFNDHQDLYWDFKSDMYGTPIGDNKLHT